MSEFACLMSEGTFWDFSWSLQCWEPQIYIVYFLLHCHSDQMVGLNEPQLFGKLNYHNFKIYCHKIRLPRVPCRFYVSALSLLFLLILNYIITLCSDEEITFNVSTEGDKTHTVSVTIFPASCKWLSRFSNVFTSFQREVCPFYR